MTYHSLTVDLPLQCYFFGGFTSVSTCICIRLHHFSNRGQSTVACCPRLMLMRWFVSSIAGENAHTHTHSIATLWSTPLFPPLLNYSHNVGFYPYNADRLKATIVCYCELLLTLHLVNYTQTHTSKTCMEKSTTNKLIGIINYPIAAVVLLVLADSAMAFLLT